MNANTDDDPMAHLGREHAELERVFRLLDGMLDEIASGADVPRAEFALVVDYLNLFGDLRHHDKEESLLVPVLVRHGFDWFEGPLARMRRDHRQERYLVRVLSDLARQDRPWSNEDRRHLLGVGREFVTFMRAHVALENERILGPARASLPSDVKASLLAEFNRFDAEHAGSTDYAAVRERLSPLLAEGASRPRPHAGIV